MNDSEGCGYEKNGLLIGFILLMYPFGLCQTSALIIILLINDT